jgi:hypothetical protein
MASLHPGDNAGRVLDYATADDSKFYHRATKGLEVDSKFDLSMENLRLFLDNVSERAQVYGWNKVLNVPTAGANPANAPLNILEIYRTVTMADCTMHAKTYLVVPARAAQNSVMLYHFLYSSLTKTALAKVTNEKPLYTVRTYLDGLCFLRLIISKAQLDTIGTVETYRKAMRSFHTKIVEFSGYIRDFHQHVNNITNSLDSYGQTYPELQLNLLEAYDTIEDPQFNTFIMVTRFNYTANPALYDASAIMNAVENLYMMRVQAGTWTPGLQKQKLNDIAALTAKIDALTASSSKGGGGKGMSAKERAEKYAWKSIPPKDGESTKVFEDRTYHWYEYHKMWAMHTPDSCQGAKYNKNKNKDKEANTTTTEKDKSDKKPAVKVSEALRAYIESTNDNCSD